MNPNIRLASIFVDELRRGGVQEVCIAPGSRSTPLALAFSAHPGFKIYLHLDERSAAFFALGLALGHRRPVALLCTSGSAAANFFPAIIEARMSRVPLLILTADRPHELRGSGANQTIDQVKLYGDQVLWSVDLPLPEEEMPELAQRNLRTLAARAIAIADGILKGPVHLNFPFRKPLEPDPGERLPEFDWRPDLRAHTRIVRGKPAPEAELLKELAEIIQNHERGVIVCGPRCPGDNFPKAVAAVARASGYPMIADPLSGMRFGCEEALGGYDAYLGDLELQERLLREVQVVLRFGSVPTSAALAGCLERVSPKYRIHIVEHGEWQDDTHRTNLFVQADPALTCEELLRLLPERKENEWGYRLREVERRYWETLAMELGAEGLTEGAVAVEILDALPVGGRLWVGNSLPVRHLDAYGKPGSKHVEVFGSRGASGIDGNISTALGVAACDPGRPLVAFVGDLTFYHDMNGLYALRKHNLQNVVIVLLNNNGGGIFQRLPVSRWEPPFEELFLTPHDLHFQAAAELYGMEYRLPKDRESLQRELRESLGKINGPRLIEIQTNSKDDLRRHREVMGAVIKTLKREIEYGELANG